MRKRRVYGRQHEEQLRTKIINQLIEVGDYKKHLEIGVFQSHLNFDKIKVDYKVGVDPGKEGYAEATFTMTSDEFFELTDDKFDTIFIDGLHHADQVYKDIVNSLGALKDGGTIICHDMNPQREEDQQIPQIQDDRVWNGDCWKAFVQLRMERDDLKMCVIDADWGLGIIQRGSQEKIEEAELTYENFNKNREKWLNLISPKEFFDKWVKE